MRLFLNSADPDDVKMFASLGLISGVTTNPSMLAKSSEQPLKLVNKLCAAYNGPISVQVPEQECSKLVDGARLLSSISPNIIIKLPATAEGFRAASALKNEGVDVNMTLCFSVGQVIWAANMGLRFASIFSGRASERGLDATGIIRDSVNAIKNLKSTTQVIAASISKSTQLIEAATAGADIATAAPEILFDLVDDPMTKSGLESFCTDWNMAAKQLA